MKLILFLLIVSAIILILFLIACLKVSSKCSREEEGSDFYKVIGTYTERKKIREKTNNKKIG